MLSPTIPSTQLHRLQIIPLNFPVLWLWSMQPSCHLLPSFLILFPQMQRVPGFHFKIFLISFSENRYSLPRRRYSKCLRGFSVRHFVWYRSLLRILALHHRLMRLPSQTLHIRLCLAHSRTFSHFRHRLRNLFYSPLGVSWVAFSF